ncbi:MAG: hypothetical protein KKA42_02585, partial [candidate division Zixibacteria bacterium]|nr:hypothetical protein [candidate division Zixibacteria bacterium]
MITKLLTASMLVCLLACSAAATENGVRCALSVYQYDADAGVQVLLTTDTAEIVKDIPATGFLAAVSMELSLRSLDTQSV